MFITVNCPKCGRAIKAKKKFVLSSGGVPCLKCKVRIPVSREQVEAYVPQTAAVEPAEAAAPTPAEPAESVEPAAPVASAPEPVPEPDKPEPATPAVTPVAAVPAIEALPTPPLESDDDETVTAAIATDGQPTEEAAATGPIAGAQIVFTCPQCQTHYNIKQSLAGKKIRCKSCSRIVKVAPDSPLVPGSEPAPPPPPPPPDDDIPVVYSVSVAHESAPEPEPVPVVPIAPPPAPAAPPPRSPAASSPPPLPGGDATEEGVRLRKALAEAEDRASTAEEMLHRTHEEKIKNDMAALRRIRELEGQIRELNGRLAAQEKAGALTRAELESLSKDLCRALDVNIQDQTRMMTDLKRQLTELMLPPSSSRA